MSLQTFLSRDPSLGLCKILSFFFILWFIVTQISKSQSISFGLLGKLSWLLSVVLGPRCRFCNGTLKLGRYLGEQVNGLKLVI